MNSKLDFLMSTEVECLTARTDDPHDVPPALRVFMTSLAKLAPTIPCESGQFNGYGRIYIDCGHVELAMAECDSPYSLVEVVECQQELAAQAVAEVKERGMDLLLANNNHSGLLTAGCPIWGAHENYLVNWRPQRFGEYILPFLVTRIYGGAGGVEYPCGRFLAAVRPIRMDRATGGGTTDCRAIHSTGREEHFSDRPNRFRYHLILGDGHRSQFNLALQFGATALALKAMQHCPRFRARIDKLKLYSLRERQWVRVLRKFNVLQSAEQSLSVDPLVIETQRVYLDGAREFAESLPDAPAWIERTLCDWDATLTALEQMDRPWLAARLDAFAKYEFYSEVIHSAGFSWSQLPDRKELFQELAILDHSYHSFCEEDSVFNRLEAAGLLKDRVIAKTAPGDERHPFVPEVKTRAVPRARFIAEHPGNEYSMYWTTVLDRKRERFRELNDPFATEYSDWSPPRRRTRYDMLGDVPF